VILEIISGAAMCAFGINLVALYMLYRQYIALAQEAVEFAGIVLTSLEEDDGEIRVDPMVLAGVSMDHLSHVTGLVRWIRL